MAAGTQTDATGMATTVAPVVERIDNGQFAQAHALIDSTLMQPGIPESQRTALEFERERMRRILIDFSLDEEAARQRVRRSIPDLRDAEFDDWTRSGLLESLRIDGKRRYFNRSVSNLFLLSADAASRRTPPVAPPQDGPHTRTHPHHRQVRQLAIASGQASAAPRRVRVTQTLTVEAGAVPAGELVRAWVPYPRNLPGQQQDIRLLDSEPSKALVASESAQQRTVYLEQPAVAGTPTRFSIQYELTVLGRYHQIDPSRVLALGERPDLAPYLVERSPHIVYTDALRRFSREAVGDERNPYRIAQKLFAAVDRIPWAGAREYATLSNISDYALHAGHADCGQQTLLLMALLRLNGIPARWQSGMVYSDGDYDNLHDWGQLYLAPYGWVPMDVTTGRLDDTDPGIEWFYLGGLDAYRIAFNDDYASDLFPAKHHFRSDTVDSQRGEVEWQGGNLYFDQWDYSFEARVVSPTRD
ncbi:transglutaminase-like domain-containing protein [Montanilutibacter psychrotolerans]